MATLKKVDVAIIGGGLAGTTLAIQLLQQMPDIQVLVIEKAERPAPEAAHKVGESTVEIGAHYFTKVLRIAHELRESKIPKLGLRFFVKSNAQMPLEERVEIGQAYYPVVHTYNFDRGRMENILWKQCQARGVKCMQDTRVKNVELDARLHTLTLDEDGEVHTVQADWVVDAGGRSSLLRRRMKLAKETEHDVNSVWFRLNTGLKVDELSDDAGWQKRVPFGMRWLSTNHLMGRGYWVWLIPLSSGAISIGLVADEKLHPFAEVNRFEKLQGWLSKHEPELAAAVEANKDSLMDFKTLRHFAHGAAQVYSPDRWCLTGEAGVFSDPFYSLGSDLIAISNTFVTTMIKTDREHGNGSQAAMFYNDLYLRLYPAIMILYQQQYPLMGNPHVMCFKVIWDFAIYWGTTGLLFYQHKLEDQDFMAQIADDLWSMFQLNAVVQDLFRRWDELDPADWARNHFLNYLDVDFLYRWQTMLEEEMTAEQTKAQLHSNRRMLEKLTIWMHQRATGAEEPIADALQATLKDLTPEQARAAAAKVDLNFVADLNAYMAREPAPSA